MLNLVIWTRIHGCEAGASVVAVGRVHRFLARKRLPRLGRESHQPGRTSILDALVDQSRLGTAPTEVAEGRIHAKPRYVVLRESGAGGDRGLAIIGEIKTPSWPAE